MQLARTSLVFFTLALSALVGCGNIDEDFEQSPPLATGAQALRGDTRPPPNGMNGTSPGCFWAPGTQKALRSLGGAALDQGAGLLPAFPLSQVSQQCREVLRSAVECALTPEQTVRDPVTDELYQGWWGLAPSWQEQVLSTEGRRYVTACMVQRLNYYGASVPILLEGSHPALASSQLYSAEFPIEESTVFGDLFSSSAPLTGLLPPFNVYVCWESLLPQSCGLLNLPLLFEERICDDVPLCGLVTLGPCALSCVEDGSSRKCRSSLLSPWRTETVRVRLETASCQ